jgi:hypothetical protein
LKCAALIWKFLMAIDKPCVYRYYHIRTSNLVLWLIIVKARQRLKCIMSTPQDALPVFISFYLNKIPKASMGQIVLLESLQRALLEQ